MEIYEWRYPQMGIRTWKFFLYWDGDGGKSLSPMTFGIGMKIVPPPSEDICLEDILEISHIKLIFIIFLIQK